MERSGRAVERREELTRGHGKAVGEGERTTAAQLRALRSVTANPAERNERTGAECRPSLPSGLPSLPASSLLQISKYQYVDVSLRASLGVFLQWGKECLKLSQ